MKTLQFIHVYWTQVKHLTKLTIGQYLLSSSRLTLYMFFILVPNAKFCIKLGKLCSEHLTICNGERQVGFFT